MSEIIAGAGGAQLDYVQSLDPSGFAAAAITANSAVLMKVRVGRALPVTQMTVFIGAASGNIQMGIYQSDGTTATKVAATASTTAAGANALQTIALTAAYTMLPGVDYYLVVSPDNATVTIGKLGGNGSTNLFQKRALSYATSFPLPATFTLASGGGSGSNMWIAAS